VVDVGDYAEIADEFDGGVLGEGKFEASIDREHIIDSWQQLTLVHANK
jgi:hypothetical protein